ncbi:Intramembrane protease RasP/YluC, implicated in cell division based on FtsL cleavage [hydrothermal vent metagenome]|uniref:Intramembrane protease RasP/YluC, implicated in cell division based on FtsL cleavage n=1 Tax=hydrothermal vent metagenome TaxID=652676 RepID=A0A3B0W516_9ZZZZ
MDFLHNIFFFIVAIGVLVTFHEFGHYWVARKAGVKVLRFSVGFGNPLLSWRRKTAEGDDIEYVIAAIPLGGYVKMLDEREGNVSDTDKARAFNNQTISKRIAIVFAGPAFNFILAIFLYWIVFMLGSTVDRPFVGEVDADSIVAKAGFQPKDEVLLVGNAAVKSWNGFRLEFLNQGLNGGDIPIQVRDADGLKKTRTLALGDMHILEDEGDVFKHIGFKQWWPKLKPEIGGVMKESAAENAGIRQGDVVVKVNGVAIDEWMTLVKMIRKNPNVAMDFIVLREGLEKNITIIPKSREVKVDGEAGQKIEQQGYIGAYQHISEEIRQQLVTQIKYSPLEAGKQAVIKTWDMSSLTLRVLWKMVSGEANLANISGPITIATYAGVTASIGLVSFLSFLAVISVSLGVLNLLPVPMLDGGHLLYYVIEIIKGSPVSEAFELRGQQLGIAVLALLMSIAIFNDIQRLVQ